ncbi:MAG: trypsin-like serine protease, partial [Chitinophagales bacterium]
MIEFDLINNTIDTLPMVDIDTTIENAHTAYSMGSYNQNFAFLDEAFPTQNIYPNTQYTYKRRASLDYDIEEYPIRTALQLCFVDNDTLIKSCSATMISSKHALTAGHCVANLQQNIVFDSLYVRPIFDNGIENTTFLGSDVSKIYVFEDMSMANDIAILELNDNIGEKTGWQSIGFEQDDSLLLDGIFYKVSYPGTTILQWDSNEYNGDTLYYGYGKATWSTDNNMGVLGVSGIPGESGSAISKVQNGNFYIIYGVLSYANGLSHTKLNRNRYYTIKSIISDDLILSIPFDDTHFSIYPNPSNGELWIENGSELALKDVKIYNALGQNIVSYS